MAAAAKTQPARGDEESELKQLIRTRSLRIGRFTLTSGRESDLYANLKPTMMHPRGAHLCARAFLSRIPRGVEWVGGLEMGAVPIVAALAAVSDIEGRPIRTFFVRKAAKAHGTRELVEGLASGESLEGRRVLVAEDVATTGGSILAAVEAVRGLGAQVSEALVVIDRREGAAEALAVHGVALISVFTGDDFR